MIQIVSVCPPANIFISMRATPKSHSPRNDCKVLVLGRSTEAKAGATLTYALTALASVIRQKGNPIFDLRSPIWSHAATRR